MHSQILDIDLPSCLDLTSQSSTLRLLTFPSFTDKFNKPFVHSQIFDIDLPSCLDLTSQSSTLRLLTFPSFTDKFNKPFVHSQIFDIDLPSCLDLVNRLLSDFWHLPSMHWQTWQASCTFSHLRRSDLQQIPSGRPTGLVPPGSGGWNYYNLTGPNCRAWFPGCSRSRPNNILRSARVNLLAAAPAL